MASNSKKRARSPASGDEDHVRYTIRSSKKSKKSSKYAKQRIVGTEEEDGDEDQQGDDPDINICDDYEPYRIAARAITRCIDMFCDIGKAITVALWVQRNPEEGDDMEEPQNFKKIPEKTVERYKCVYQTIVHFAPGIKELVNNPAKSSEYREIIKVMNKTMKTTRSDDSARLRDKVGFYAAFDPVGAPITPAIYPSSSKSQLGLNHIVLAGLLCPIDSLQKFKQDPERTRHLLVNGKIDMSDNEFPSFLWTRNGEAYDGEDVLNGLFKGHCLERVFRHIFHQQNSPFISRDSGTSQHIAERPVRHSSAQPGLDMHSYYSYPSELPLIP